MSTWAQWKLSHTETWRRNTEPGSDGDDDDICKGPVASRRVTNSAVWCHDPRLRCQRLYSTLFHIIVRVNSFFFFSQKRQIMCSCYYDNAFDLLDSLKGFGEHFEKCCPIE